MNNINNYTVKIVVTVTTRDWPVYLFTWPPATRLSFHARDRAIYVHRRCNERRYGLRCVLFGFFEQRYRPTFDVFRNLAICSPSPGMYV